MCKGGLNNMDALVEGQGSGMYVLENIFTVSVKDVRSDIL